MRTNIDIDDELMARAMQAGPFKTKREAVEAGLKLLARQAAYKEILKWRGKLRWEGDESIDWTKAPAGAAPVVPGEGAAMPLVQESPAPAYGAASDVSAAPGLAGDPTLAAPGRKRRARR